MGRGVSTRKEDDGWTDLGIRGTFDAGVVKLASVSGKKNGEVFDTNDL